MKSPTTCFFTALAACLAGCGLQADQTITEFNAAAWIARDREALYIHHTFSGHQDGLVRVTSVYSSSTIQVYRRTLEDNGFGKAVLVFKADSALPCGELVYHPSDSLVYMSFKKMDRENVIERHYCGDFGSRYPEKRYLQFKLTDGLVDSLPVAVSDSAVQSELTQSRGDWAREGIAIDSLYESLCVGNRCIYD